MFLNTKSIKDSVLSTNTIVESVVPFLQKDQQIENIKLEKERKLQEQVALIFKDRAYYKQFQEAVIPPTGMKPPAPLDPRAVLKKPEPEEEVVLTPQEKARQAREDEIRAKQMGHATKNVVIGAGISSGINTIGGALIRKALGA